MAAIPPEPPGQLTEAQENALCAFVGYGNCNAPVWFMGIEEKTRAGADLAQMVADLVTRAAWPPQIDLMAAHNELGIHNHHGDPFNVQSTWRVMCKIMLFSQMAVLPPNITRADVQAYQANDLGRLLPGKETFLSELLPIPKKSVNAYEYAECLRWPSLNAYRNDVRPARIGMLRNILRDMAPEVFFGYGVTNWANGQADGLFPGGNIGQPTPELLDLMNHWCPWGSPLPFQIGWANCGRTLVILTRHYRWVTTIAWQKQLAQLMRHRRLGHQLPIPI